MRVIKLDRRHKHSKEYSTAMQFSEWEFKRTRHWAYRDALKQLFGEESTYVFKDPAVVPGPGRWVYNEHYRIDRIKYRINLKDPSVVTLLELMVPHD